MSSEQASAVNTAMTTTTQAVLSDFITILPTIGIIIGVAFIIGLVSYWLKKLRKVK